MKRCVCLQHVPFEGPGVFAGLLKSRGYELSCHLVPEKGLPDSSGDFLLVMGGPMSVNDPDPWIGEEVDFIRNSVTQGIPYLGVCLGSQLLAKAFGGEVYPGPAREVGMCPIRLSACGRLDPALGPNHLPAKVFQWYGEGIRLSAGLRSLAYSDAYPVQAFQVGFRAYGLLFHAEMRAEDMQALCMADAAYAQGAGLDPAAVATEAMNHLPALHAFAERMVDHLDRLGRGPVGLDT